MSLARRGGSSLLLALMLALALVALATARGANATPTAKASSHTRSVIIKGRVHHHRAIFHAPRRLRATLRNRRVRAAEVRVAGRRKRISVKKVKKTLGAGAALTVLAPLGAPAPAAPATPSTPSVSASTPAAPVTLEMAIETAPATPPVTAPTTAPTTTTQPAATPDPPAPSTATVAGCELSILDLDQYVDGRRPPACWRPYASTSPFNVPIPDDPRLAPNSSAVVSRMLGFGRLQNMGAGDAGSTFDGGTPAYFALPTDPVFTLHCTEPWGTCPIEGMQVHVPDNALPEGAEDKHLTVVDTATGWEYDLWEVQDKPQGGGRLVLGWGGKTRIDGDGLGSDGNAAGYGGMAGGIRAEELLAGKIDHALIIAVKCDNDKFVYPARKLGMSCTELGLPTENAPAMGQRFQFNMPAEQIDQLKVPDYEKTILKAFSKYGAYVSDTGGAWAFDRESGQVYASFGVEDKWVTYAKKIGATYYAPDSRYVLPVAEGVDWSRYLRVIDPCTTQRTC